MLPINYILKRREGTTRLIDSVAVGEQFHVKDLTFVEVSGSNRSMGMAVCARNVYENWGYG